MYFNWIHTSWYILGKIELSSLLLVFVCRDFYRNGFSLLLLKCKWLLDRITMSWEETMRIRCSDGRMANALTSKAKYTY